MGIEVIHSVQNFFRFGHMLKEVNNSFIVLIPKVPNPTFVNQFRPISLCNTVYKIISKLLVARIRLVLSKLVSLCQSAFILGRWIAENQVVVQELFHSFKRQKVKGGFVAMKLDLQKTYDRVNWGFLRTVLHMFGFKSIFVNWIMECVSSVSFSILINGCKTKHFQPSWGLRQGDPLSPYLFILCQEVLSRMIESKFLSGAIKGLKMNLAGPTFTHVMYVDDIMMFAKANYSEIAVIDQCSVDYCAWLGQLINRDKSGIFFSKHV